MFGRRTPKPDPVARISEHLLDDLPPELRILVHMAQLASLEQGRPANAEQFEFMLRQSGHTELEVRRALVFVPIAFCSDVIQRMGMQYSEEDTYFVMKEDSDEPERKRLSDEPIYVAALSSIDFVMEHFGSACFLQIAAMSAEMNAINKMLKSGGTVEGMRGGTVNPSFIPESFLKRRLGR